MNTHKVVHTSTERNKKMSEEPTIYQQIEQIKAEICDNYCRYTNGSLTDDEWEQIWEEKCQECPLSRL